MRVIDIPPDAVPEPEKQPEVKITFKDFVTGAYQQYKPYGTWDKMDRAALMRKTLREATDVFRMEDADYDDLLNACKTASFNPNVAEHLLVFKKAILDAQKVPTPTEPKKKEEEPEKK